MNGNNQERQGMNQNVQESGISAKKLSIIALAIALNVVGGQIALLLHLPVYLDSIGTILIAVIYGPFYGILPPLLYGMVMGFTLDIYSLYFMPVGIILGLTTGIVSRALNLRGRLIVPGALIITIPGTITSALITALLFGGITSSGSTVIVQILNKAGMGLTASVFVVQILTDYLDRLISLALVAALLRAIPARLYKE
jgi:energy-coupling factor transport system substrate-specific component